MLLFILATSFKAYPGDTINFNENWKFHLGDTEGADQLKYNDNSWSLLDVPHDWSVEGSFDQNEPAGGNGGYLPTGIGWYRKHFKLPAGSKNKLVWIEFDGVYMNSEVWINGHFLGKRPYGYISFKYDLTPYLKSGDNIISVKVDNSLQPNSRWYSGSGIYRNVRLVIQNPIHISHWGVYATTPEVSAESAIVNVKVQIENEDKKIQKLILQTILVDPSGSEVESLESEFEIEPGELITLEENIDVKSPNLWSLENPNLYTLKTIINDGNKNLDNLSTIIGIRNIEYDAMKGFFLNGERVKMNGVNLHHGGGCVGAAVPIGVWERRLLVLKEMGCNAIRTAHNPVAPEFLDLCDRLGFLVMNEVFDEWKLGKREFAYNKYFDEWWERDLIDFIHRDRNHPSVVMWSVGNEIPEQKAEGGHLVLAKLMDITHREDPTRPATLGCDNIVADGGATTLEFMEGLDIVGYNYIDRWHERRELFNIIDKIEHPEWKMIGTESVSIYGQRGSYSLGNDPEKVNPNYNTRMIRAEQLWKYISTRDFMIGDFMWTGIDYLGESRWPGKQASSGAIDICGFPKDAFYFYQSQWTEEPMIHLFPHWNWEGREGQVIPVLAYSNCDEIELFLNGKSYGIKKLEFPRPGNSGSWRTYDKPPVNAATADLHLSWDIPYESGTLKAVGKKDGEVVVTKEIKTVGQPVAIKLSIDELNRDLKNTDVVHFKVEAIDKEGLTIPTADNLINFSINGPGKIIGVDNGNPTDHNSYQDNRRNLFNGLGLVIIKPTGKSGTIQLNAESENLKSSAIEIVL